MTQRATTLLLTLALAACGGDSTPDRERVLLVTTTSVEGSGLLDALTAAYHDAQGRYHLSTTAVGSGAALELGRRGDADVLITHDSAGEATFVAAGHAAEQGPVMMNDFLLVGPVGDPAGARGDDAVAALRAIAAHGAPFISRGDDSGTHTRERSLWAAAGIDPAAVAGYVESGTGMTETLQMADQLEGYTLTDRGTFRNLRARLDLVPLTAGDPMLLNPYSYTIPRRARNEAGARDFVRWLRGPGQQVIGRHGLERFGEPLFAPTATPPG